VNVEVTVALPLIVSALVESHADVIASRKAPQFSFDEIEPARVSANGRP